MSVFDDQAHYNERYKYYTLLKEYETKKIDFWEFCGEFMEIYEKTEKLITSLLRNREKSETFFVTSKSSGFRYLITQIWWEVCEPEFREWTLEKEYLSENLNSDWDPDSEEANRLRENYIQKCFKMISMEMEIFLDFESETSSD